MSVERGFGAWAVTGVWLMGCSGSELCGADAKLGHLSGGGDITYIWTAEGRAYLAVLLDLYSRRVVGWRCASRSLLRGRIRRALPGQMPTGIFVARPKFRR